ncbi:MAG: nicotinate phosphoribosyltransferase, partial [Bryobacteraceae bacterium]
DLGALSHQVRRILDAGGLKEAKIFATNDLDEYRIAELVTSGAPIDAFGVGTQLATSGDAPSLAAIYKLVELRMGEALHYTAKYSEEKSTLPAAKQVYRYSDRDVISLYNECDKEFTGRPLVRPIIIKGELLEPLPSAAAIRHSAMAAIDALPAELRSLEEMSPYPVDISSRLNTLAEELRGEYQFTR